MNIKELKYLYTVILSVFTLFGLYGQRVVEGYVYDSQSKQAMEYVNVVCKTSKNGTLTDNNGYFNIEVSEEDEYLLISLIGYASKDVKLNTSSFKIYLEEDSAVLEEVVLTADKRANPAHFILKKIRQNHKKNSLKRGKTFSYKKYDKVRFDVYDTDSTFKHLGPFKSFDELTSQKYKKEDKYFVPFLLVEEINKVYGKTNPVRTRDLLEASRVSGEKNNPSISNYLKELYLDYDVFDNNIVMFNKKFVSPLSSRALLTYKYAIVDSVHSENGMVYKIQYFPRRERELNFEGFFWADTARYVVHSIELKAAEGFNVNFVNSIYIKQDFAKINQDLYTVSKDSISVDLTPFKQWPYLGAEISKVTNYYEQKVDVIIPFSFISNIQPTTDNVFTKSNSDWNKIRPVGLQSKDLQIYEMHDSLAKNKRFRAYRNLGEMLASGWYRIGKIDYGPYYNTLGYNSFEGLRMQVGARTYFSRNDKWRVGGYVAYGTKDEKAKYGLYFSYLLSQSRRWIFSVGYRNDLEQRGVLLSQENNVYSRNFASSLFTIGENNKLTNTISYAAQLETEVFKNVRMTISSKYERMTSVSGFNMSYLDSNGEVKNFINDFQVSYSLIITPNRKEIGYGVDRDVVTYWHPTIRFSYIRGMAGVFDSSFDYNKFKFYYRHPFLTGLFGKTILVTEAGTTLGTVPLQLLDIIPGNQTISIQENMFGMMDYYEFVSDTYATLHIDHHFNGRITSKIPLLNRLDLRTVAGARVAWGDILNKENYNINLSEVTYQTPDKGYLEFSAGIENIFKVLRVDAVWRASYLNNANASPFGIRFLLKVLF